MEATVLNTAQQHILRMLSFVKEEQTVLDVENVLRDYFAKKLDSSLDELIADGTMSNDISDNYKQEISDYRAKKYSQK